MVRDLDITGLMVSETDDVVPGFIPIRLSRDD